MSALHRIELCVVLIPLKWCWLHSVGEGEAVLAHSICTIFENKRVQWCCESVQFVQRLWSECYATDKLDAWYLKAGCAMMHTFEIDTSRFQLVPVVLFFLFTIRPLSNLISK